MNFPFVIRLDPYAFNVVAWPAKKSTGQGRIGEFAPMEMEIRIREDMPEEKQKTTLLHELLHGCFYTGALEDGMAEEKIVEVLTLRLYSLFQQNPQLKDILFS